jgi:Cysteine-rich secretory protein family
MKWWFWTLLLTAKAGSDFEPKFMASTTYSFGPSDFCDLTCDGAKHTLCQQPERTAKVCERFELIRIDEDLRNQLVLGHNGLRDRFARLQNAKSMRILDWDQDLAEMAERWARTCEKYAIDPCTQLKRDFSE